MKAVRMSLELPNFDLERYLPYRFTVIAAQMSAHLARQYKAQFGISMPEWRVLLNVGYSDDTSVRDIEKRVNLEKSKVSRAASKLEAKGFVTKQVDDQDRRLIKLKITEQGAELLRQLIPIAQTYQAQLLKSLGEESDQLHHILDRITDLNP
jgi:DNA-binding MarR family transcriptional regulator